MNEIIFPDIVEFASSKKYLGIDLYPDTKKRLELYAANHSLSDGTIVYNQDDPSKGKTLTAQIVFLYDIARLLMVPWPHSELGVVSEAPIVFAAAVNMGLFVSITSLVRNSHFFTYQGYRYTIAQMVFPKNIVLRQCGGRYPQNVLGLNVFALYYEGKSPGWYSEMKEMIAARFPFGIRGIYPKLVVVEE